MQKDLTRVLYFRGCFSRMELDDNLGIDADAVAVKHEVGNHD